jgi:hypothetical protein
MKMLLVTFGLLGMTSGFGQDVTLKKLYDGIEDMQIASNLHKLDGFGQPYVYEQDGIELIKLLAQNHVRSKQICDKNAAISSGEVSINIIVSGSFTKPRAKQDLYVYAQCSFDYSLAILESGKLVAVYSSGAVFNTYSVKDINANGLTELMIEVQSNAKGVWGEMHAIQLLEFPNGKPNSLGSFFIGGPPGYFINGSDNNTCSPTAPKELQKSFPSNIIYVQKGKVPQFFAEGWEVNCDYLEKGVKAKKVSSLTPIRPVPRAVPLTRLF